MSREIYVPIADSFFESSIMREELPVRFVMLALIRLALRAGANGVVDIDPQIFALSINLPLPDVEAAIRRLMEPDPASSSEDEDGRRIVPVNPARPFRNWRLVNWPKYQTIVHRANDAARKRDEYHAKKEDTGDLPHSPEVSVVLQKSPSSSSFRATRTSTKTRGREEGRVPSPPKGVPTSEETVTTRKRVVFVAPSRREISEYAISQGWTATDWSTLAFFEFYACKGWVIGRAPMKDWRLTAQRAHREGWTVKNGSAPADPATAAAAEEARKKSLADARAKMREQGMNPDAE